MILDYRRLVYDEYTTDAHIEDFNKFAHQHGFTKIAGGRIEFNDEAALLALIRWGKWLKVVPE